MGLGNEAKIKKPSKSSGNWKWRLKKNQVNKELSILIRKLKGRR